jgi:hypothetical protein
MPQKKNWRYIAGLTLHLMVGGFMVLLGGLMIATAWARFACLPMMRGMEAAVQFEISDYLLPRREVTEVSMQIEACVYLMIIGIGQLVTGLLLMSPSTSVAGALLASTFWGAAISLRMTHGEPYLLQSVFLILSWIGLYLRNPAVLGGFSGGQRTEENPWRRRFV